MIGQLAEIADACDLSLPERFIRPIGIVGTGIFLAIFWRPPAKSEG